MIQLLSTSFIAEAHIVSLQKTDGSAEYPFGIKVVTVSGETSVNYKYENIRDKKILEISKAVSEYNNVINYKNITDRLMSANIELCKRIAKLEKQNEVLKRNVANLMTKSDKDTSDDEIHKENRAEAANVSVLDLELSTRSKNSLYREGIKTLADIVILSRKELSNVKHLGKKSVAEIISVVTELGYTIE